MRKIILPFMLCFLVFLCFGYVILAQSGFPIGGTDFASAAEIKPGLYQGGTLGWDDDAGVTQQFYYLLGVKPGQSIEAKVMFRGNTNLAFVLYDENKIKLTDVYGGEEIDSLAWLTDSSSKSGRYYLSLKNDAIDDMTDISLDLKVVDLFDAGSQTDAGGSINEALPINSGNYQGYLSGEQGKDEADFYRLSLKKGVRTTVKITPPNQDSINIEVFDVGRTRVEEASPSNEGAITNLSFIPANDGVYYVGLTCYYGCKTILNYQMEISGAVIPTGGGVMTTGEQVNISPSNISPTTGSATTNKLPLNDRDKKFLFLIIGTVVAIILIVYFLLRKKPETHEVKPEVKTEEKPETPAKPKA